MKLPLIFPEPGRKDHGPQVLFRAWIRVPMSLNAGDEIEIDMLRELLSDTMTGLPPRTIRAVGQISRLAVHSDGQLWYEFAAASACEIVVHPVETNSKYPPLSIGT